MFYAVGDRQRGGVGAGLGIGVRGVDAVRAAAVAEVPVVGRRSGVGRARCSAGECYGQRRHSQAGVRPDDRCGVGVITQPVDRAGGAVDVVDVAFGPQFQVDGTAFDGRFHGTDFAPAFAQALDRF